MPPNVAFPMMSSFLSQVEISIVPNREKYDPSLATQPGELSRIEVVLRILTRFSSY